MCLAYVNTCQSPSFQNTFSQLAEIKAELEETWNNAAMLGEDAVLETHNFAQSQAIDYKRRVVNKIMKAPEKPKQMSMDSFSQDSEGKQDLEAKREHMQALAEARKTFLHRITFVEKLFRKEINEIIDNYDDNLSLTNEGMTEYQVFSANDQYIHRSAVAQELFQAAVDVAELTYREAEITAEENVQECTRI